MLRSLHSFALLVIVFIVENLNKALSDKEHFLNLALVRDHDLAWDVDPAKHVDDQLVGEASLTLFKEMVESFLKILEGSC